MVIHVTDGQLVGETESTMFTLLQQGPVNVLVIIKNSCVNTMSYRFQEFTGNGWNDLGASGTDFYSTLQPSEVKTFKLTSAYPQVQMVANASGGAFLDFSLTRYWNSAAGGTIPILAL